MLTMLKQTPAESAAQQRVAVLIDYIGEELAGHTDHTAFPVLQVAFIDTASLFHESLIIIYLYYYTSGELGNGGSSKKAKGFYRPHKRQAHLDPEGPGDLHLGVSQLTYFQITGELSAARTPPRTIQAT